MLLKEAMMEFGLSARAHDKICKVARTIADLAGCEDIKPEHVAEAVGYRKIRPKALSYPPAGLAPEIIQFCR